MSTETVFTHARIVTPDAVIEGSLAVRDGRIAAFGPGDSALPGAIDCQGDYLMPGLVELHTDNLEKHVTPRPKVTWPAASAVLAHDAQMAGAGITTVFDAIACGDVIQGSSRMENLQAMVEAVVAARTDGRLRADHLLHLRCEVSCDDIVETFETFRDIPILRIVSLMDHSPGQRQFVDDKAYRTYYMGKHHLNDAEMDIFGARMRAMSARNSDPHRRAIAAQARERGLVLASHDDATEAHVEEAMALGVAFAEFPTTLDAARSAEDHGMKILMGAPNVVRGGSHSGNLSATTLAEAGCLDILSSDYVPVSLLQGVMLLTREPHGFPLPKALAMATRTPARVAGLTDRGEIAETRRADLIRVRDTGTVPVVRGVWREGERVA